MAQKIANDKTDTFTLSGDQLLQKVKDIIREGNARRITIKNKEGKTLIIAPLSIGVIGAVLAPPLVAVAAIAAIATDCTLVVERK